MTVVVGVGDVTESETAIRTAAQEARYRGTRLAAVMAYQQESVLGAPGGRPPGALSTGADRQETAAGTLQTAVRGALGDEADEVEQQVVPGLPGRVLVDTAWAAEADLVVLAARGDGTVARLLGTVSQFVLRNAPCPVLVVPERRAAMSRGTRGVPPSPAASRSEPA